MTFSEQDKLIAAAFVADCIDAGIEEDDPVVEAASRVAKEREHLIKDCHFGKVDETHHHGDDKNWIACRCGYRPSRATLRDLTAAYARHVFGHARLEPWDG